MQAAGWGIACVVGWLTAVGIGVAGYAFEPGSDPFEVMPFAVTFALAISFAVVTAWFAAGDRRRASGFAASLGGFGVGMAIVTFAAFWGCGEAVRAELGLARFRYEYHRDEILVGMATIARDFAMFALVPGIAAGAIAGGLIALSRRRAEVAGVVAVGLLLAVVLSGPSLVAAATAIFLDWRSEGGRWTGTSMSPGEVAALLGTISGSVLGATLAGLAARIMPPPSQQHAVSPS